MNWFRRSKPPRPTRSISYPDGLAVETEKAVYFIKNRRRYKFYSQRCLDSWNMTPVYGSEASLAGFRQAGTLGFRDGTLIQNYADGRIYLISGNKRRHVRNPDALARYGLEERTIVTASEAETNLHDEGESID